MASLRDFTKILAKHCYLAKSKKILSKHGYLDRSDKILSEDGYLVRLNKNLTKECCLKKLLLKVASLRDLTKFFKTWLYRKIK